MKLTPKYVPILKWKLGEQTALRELSNEFSSLIIPLIEITPEFNVKKLDTAFSCWSNKLYYFDVLSECYENDPKIYLKILDQLNHDYAIPVLKHTDSLDLINYTTKLSNNGIAIRITTNYMDTLNTNMLNILQEISPTDIDIILDFKYIGNTLLSSLYSSFLNIISSIPNVSDYRNIIISSSSFPKDLAGIPRDNINHFNMLEWHFYTEYISRYANENNFNIIYSDYCICNPSYTEFLPYMKPSFNIRYTHIGEFLIIKGNLISNGGLNNENVSRVCNTLVSSNFFTGEQYSWGDNYIYNHRLINQPSYGNLTTWRAICTNHHITHIVKLLS